MLWLFLSLLTALAVAGRDVSIKAFTDLTAQDVVMLEMSWALPLLAIGCIFVDVPPLDITFWWAFVISLPLNMAAYLLYIYAIKISPLTLTVPFLAFTPVFMILTGQIVLGETVNIWGGLGILLIVGGSYVLNLDRASEGLLKPFTSLRHEKGPLIMLVVAFLFSFAAVIAKQAILHSSPLFFSFFFFLVFNMAVLFFLMLTGKRDWRQVYEQKGKGLWLGILLVVHVGCHGLAIAISTAVYMIAVKRSSIVFSVFFSRFFLHENQVLMRSVGTAFMFAGVLVITFLAS
jgi:drug/metabolite transporter (DMT)-like permease